MSSRTRARSAARAALNRPWLSPPANDPIDIPPPDMPPVRRIAADLIVVDTKAVAVVPGFRYDIALATDPDAHPFIVVTLDETIYKVALVFEGTERKARVTYHASKRPNGRWCYRLDAIEEVAP